MIDNLNITTIRGKHRNVKLEQVYDMDNLIVAEKEARRGKGKKYGVRKFDKHASENLKMVQSMLMNRTYHTSTAKIDEQYCPCGKVRRLAKLPYCPDHIIHHALMRAIGPVITRSYYFDSAASIKGKGTEFSRKRLRRFLDKNRHRDIVFAKMDFTKFYHKISQELVFAELCRMFHDEGIRWLMREVVTAVDEGLGIGLFPIQPIANMYLNRLDRLIGKGKGGRIHLFRYCDDLLIVGFDTKEVWKAVDVVRHYADEVLHQPLHTNINVEHVTNTVGIDFVGYVFYKDYTLLRKRMKERMKRRVARYSRQIEEKKPGAESRLFDTLTSYKGWLMHCNGRNLWYKVTGMKKFSELGIKNSSVNSDGSVFFNVPLVGCNFLANHEIVVKDFQEGVDTVKGKGRFVVLVEDNGHECKFVTNNPRMKDTLLQCREMGAFPFSATMKSRSLGGSKVDYYFE